MDSLNEKLNIEISDEKISKIAYNIFYILIFILPVIPEVYDFGIYSLKNTLFNLITIPMTILVFSLESQDKSKRFNIYSILCLIYMIFVILSTFFSKYGFLFCIFGNNGRGEGTLTIFSYIMTFIIAYRGYKYAKKTFKVAIIAAIIVCLYGLIQANVPFGTKLFFGESQIFGVAEGTMGNQNMFSSYICLFLPMLCYYFLDTGKYKMLIVIALFLANLIYTKTLGGYLSFAVMYIGILIFCLWYSKNKKLTILNFSILTIVFILVFGLTSINKGEIYIKEVQAVEQEINNLVEKDENFGTHRLEIWKNVLVAIQDNKLLGVGPDSLKKEFEKDKYHKQEEQYAMDNYIIDKAHSEYLHIAVTTGIPSLIVYLILVLVISLRLIRIVLIKHNKQNYNSEDKERIFITMTLIAIITYLGQALGNISVVQVAPVFWLILGIGAGITLNENKSKKEN